MLAVELQRGVQHPAHRVEQDGGIVDQHVGRAVFRDDEIAQLLDVRFHGHIQRVEDQIAVRLRLQLVQDRRAGLLTLGLVAAGEDDAVAQPDELLGDAAT